MPSFKSWELLDGLSFKSGKDEGGRGLGPKGNYADCVVAEYVWADAHGVPRSKTKTLTKRSTCVYNQPFLLLRYSIIVIKLSFVSSCHIKMVFVQGANWVLQRSQLVYSPYIISPSVTTFRCGTSTARRLSRLLGRIAMFSWFPVRSSRTPSVAAATCWFSRSASITKCNPRSGTPAPAARKSWRSTLTLNPGSASSRNTPSWRMPRQLYRY